MLLKKTDFGHHAFELIMVWRMSWCAGPWYKPEVRAEEVLLPVHLLAISELSDFEGTSFAVCVTSIISFSTPWKIQACSTLTTLLICLHCI